MIHTSFAADSGPATTGADPQKTTASINLDTDPHLLGWWKLDETSGKTAADSSMHGHAGTLKGTLSFDTNSVPGRIGKALKFNGGGDFIEITAYKGVVGPKPRTIAAWVKSNKPQGEIMKWGTDEPGRMWRFLITGTGIRIDPRGGYYYTDSNVHDDAWHHVAVVVTEAESPNFEINTKLYQDGELPKIHDIGLLDLYPIDSGNQLDVTIGRGLEGLMDDVRLYDRALSKEEIGKLFKAAKTVP